MLTQEEAAEKAAGLLSRLFEGTIKVYEEPEKLLLLIENKKHSFTKSFHLGLLERGREYSIGNCYLLFANSDSNLTQTQILTLKLTPKPILMQTLTQTQTLTLKKTVQKYEIKCS